MFETKNANGNGSKSDLKANSTSDLKHSDSKESLGVRIALNDLPKSNPDLPKKSKSVESINFKANKSTSDIADQAAQVTTEIAQSNKLKRQSSKQANDDAIEALIQSNDSLVNENMQQMTKMKQMKLQLSETTRQVETKDQELHEMNQTIASLQDKLDENQDGKRNIERLLKSNAQEILSKETDVEQLQSQLYARQTEIDDCLQKNEELKTMVSELSERYKEVVRESTFAASREKELLEQVQTKEDEIEGFPV